MYKIRWWRYYNNKKAIHKMEQDMPIFQNVGELRKLLTNFSDDVRIYGSTFEYPLLQIRVIDNIGRIHIGSSNTPSKDRILEAKILND